jgi:hypothetical protein
VSELTREGRGHDPRPSHLRLIHDDMAEGIRTAPLRQRRTQLDSERITKSWNVIRMIDHGYITPDEALPWLRLELGA